jgi:hypothetical protein
LNVICAATPAIFPIYNSWLPFAFLIIISTFFITSRRIPVVDIVRIFEVEKIDRFLGRNNLITEKIAKNPNKYDNGKNEPTFE